MYITTGQLKKLVGAFLFVFALALLFLEQPITAAVPDDGEYTVNYEVLRGDPRDDSTSIANGYFNKPATVIMKNGKIAVRTVVNKDAWLIEFSTKKGNKFVDTKVVSRDSKNDSRTVEFEVESLDQDLVTSMTVDIPEQNYNHSYEARFRFYSDTLKLVKAAEAEPEKSSPAQSGEVAPVAKEETSNKDAVAVTPKPSSKPVASSSSNNKGEASEKPASTKAPEKAASQDKTNGTAASDSTSDHQAANAGTAGGSKDTDKEAGTIAADKQAANAQVEDTTAVAKPSNNDQTAAIQEQADANEPEGATGEGIANSESATDVLQSDNNEVELESAAEGLQVDTVEAAIETEEQEAINQNLPIIIIIVVALLIAGLIAWQVIYRKKNKQS